MIPCLLVLEILRFKVAHLRYSICPSLKLFEQITTVVKVQQTVSKDHHKKLSALILFLLTSLAKLFISSPLVFLQHSRDRTNTDLCFLGGTSATCRGMVLPCPYYMWRLFLSSVKARSHSPIFWHPRDGQESLSTASCPFLTAPKKKSRQHFNPQTLIGVEVLPHEAR